LYYNLFLERRSARKPALLPNLLPKPLISRFRCRL
jgi:hypothetical protein